MYLHPRSLKYFVILLKNKYYVRCTIMFKGHRKTPQTEKNNTFTRAKLNKITVCPGIVSIAKVRFIQTSLSPTAKMINLINDERLFHLS